jgi:hypothetical protein
MFPLAEVAFESHAFGNLKRRDEAALGLLAAFSRPFASCPVFPARPVGMRGEFGVLAGLELGEELLNRLLYLRQFRKEGLAGSAQADAKSRRLHSHHRLDFFASSVNSLFGHSSSFSWLVFSSLQLLTTTSLFAEASAHYLFRRVILLLTIPL